jgi:hypothetical protein
MSNKLTILLIYRRYELLDLKTYKKGEVVPVLN